MYTLQSAKLALTLDEKGRISSLAMAGEKNVIAKPTGLFRAVLKAGDNWEDVAFADQQQLQIEAFPEKLVLRTDSLNTRDGKIEIALTLTLTLEGDKLTFSSAIENHSEATVDDWIYPCIGQMDTLAGGRPNLLYPRHLGERVVDICGYLQGLHNREALHELTATYPGPLSMQWMTLEDGNTCLYLSGRDTLFHASALRAKGSDEGGVTLEMNKLGFVKPGETWVCPPYLMWLYHGSWMLGAKEYAAWASTWRKPVKPKEWMRKMNGYFLVINKQQFGDEVWPYDTIPKLYEYARAHGFDTLGLFGWFHTGHDNHYPDLVVSPTMGGEALLKENIRKVQEKGGHVTLYYQGHLMDVGTDYYKTTGHLLEGKTRWRTPYFEYYDKFCHSDYLHFFSKKPFATICPSCTQWHDLMADRADWIHGFGADGVLYDQIGGMFPYPCFDESHHHLQNRPSLSHTQGRIKLHQRIRAQVDQYENYAYMTENVTDVHSQFIDCVHGIGSYPGEKGSGTAGTGAGCRTLLKSENTAAGPTMMPELFRFTFPDTLITIRNPCPYVSRRFANYAFYYGYKLEMELRYLTDRQFVERDEGEQDRVYVAQIAALREAHADYLLEGRFLAEQGLTNGSPFVKAALFENASGARAAVLWNDTDEEQPVSLTAEGCEWNAWASTDAEGTGLPATIAPEQVLLLYHK